eukprot:352434-Chlamydomonas_euryale.AAC.3
MDMVCEGSNGRGVWTVQWTWCVEDPMDVAWPGDPSISYWMRWPASNLFADLFFCQILALASRFPANPTCWRLHVILPRIMFRWV